MEDVARRAGVSRALVSLALNASPKVSDLRRQRVFDACAELGYRPNAAARQLASRRNGSVGVLLNDLHNPFFAETYDGVAVAAEDHDMRLLLTTGGRRRSGEQEAIDHMLEHRVDGIILVSPRLPASAIVAASAVVPVVVVGRVVRGDRIDCITNDERRGVREGLGGDMARPAFIDLSRFVQHHPAVRADRRRIRQPHPPQRIEPARGDRHEQRGFGQPVDERHLARRRIAQRQSVFRETEWGQRRFGDVGRTFSDRLEQRVVEVDKGNGTHQGVVPK